MESGWWRGWRAAVVAVGTALVIVAVTLAVVLKIAGPGSADDRVATTNPDVALGTVATSASTTSASPTGSPQVTTATTSSAPPPAPPVTYPATADEYAMAALTAWLARDGTRIGQLASPSAITLMGQPPSGLPGGWEFYNCWYEPFAPCRQLRNDRGDVFSVLVEPGLLGKAKAVTRAYVDILTFPTTVRDYFNATIDQYYAGNAERVAMLITGQTAVWFFGTVPAAGDHNAYYDYQEFTGQSGYRCVEANAPGGASWSWAFDTTKLGQAHALVWVGYGWEDPGTTCRYASP